MSDGVVALVLVHHREALVFVGHVIAAHLEQRTHNVTVIPGNRASMFVHVPPVSLIFFSPCNLLYAYLRRSGVYLGKGTWPASALWRGPSGKRQRCRLHTPAPVGQLGGDTADGIKQKKRDRLSEIKRCCDLFPIQKWDQNKSKPTDLLLCQLLHWCVLCKGSPETPDVCVCGHRKLIRSLSFLTVCSALVKKP